MKKILALLLAACMVFALCACSSGGDTQPAADSQTTEETAPAVVDAAEEAVEEIAAANETGTVESVAGIVPSTDIAILVQMMDYIKANCEAQGIDFQLAGAMFEVAQYITLLENFVTMGVDVVVMIPMDTNAIMDACLAAEAAGTHVVFVSSPPSYADEISGGIYSDYYEVGHLTAEMACAWAKEKYPDAESIGIACTLAESDADSISRTTGIRDAIEEDPICYMAYEGFNSTAADDGYSFAEEAMTADSDVRVFVMYESDPAIGVDNFIKAYVQSSPDLSIADFGVFAVGYSPNAAALIEESANDESAFRGVGCYSALEPGEPVWEVISAIINGEELPYWLVENCYTINSFGFGE